MYSLQQGLSTKMNVDLVQRKSMDNIRSVEKDRIISIREGYWQSCVVQLSLHQGFQFSVSP
jgi:hypothetical protein